MLNSVLFFSWCPHVELLILAFYILRYWWNCYWFLMPKVPWVLSASSFLIYWCCSKEYMKVIWKRNAASVMEGTFLVKQRSTSFDDYVMIVHKMGRNFPAIPIVCDQKTKTYSWWECLLIVTINFSQSIFFLHVHRSCVHRWNCNLITVTGRITFLHIFGGQLTSCNVP